MTAAKIITPKVTLSIGECHHENCAINGSPRREWNTAQLLKSALRGAAAASMKTNLYHLYDLDFKGCISCFACKLIGGSSYGRCAVQDGLTPVLEEIRSTP